MAWIKLGLYLLSLITYIIAFRTIYIIVIGRRIKTLKWSEKAHRRNGWIVLIVFAITYPFAQFVLKDINLSLMILFIYLMSSFTIETAKNKTMELRNIYEQQRTKKDIA